MKSLVRRLKNPEKRFFDLEVAFFRLVGEHGGLETDSILQGLLSDFLDQGISEIREGMGFCDFCQDLHCCICGEGIGMVEHEFELCVDRRTKADVDWVINRLKWDRPEEARAVLEKVEREGRLEAFEARLDVLQKRET